MSTFDSRSPAHGGAGKKPDQGEANVGSASPTPARPYGSQALRYFTHGWSPLPAGSRAKPLDKDPYPAGYTGAEGKRPDEDQIAQWVKTRDGYNLALRLPGNIVGVDVDAWKGASEVETMKAITEAHGLLPRTWVTTSRSDSSGIRLFRLPDSVDAKNLSGDINHPTDPERTAGEVIKFNHRVAIVWPSIHPDTGNEYHWLDQTTGEIVSDGTLPKLDDLPELPAEWVDHFLGECSCYAGGYDWSKIKATSGDPVADCFDKWHTKLVSGTYSRHDAALSGSQALVSFRYKSWPGAEEYLRKLEEAFIASATSPGEDQRTEGKARAEWQRMVDGAEKKAPSTSIPRYEEPARAKTKNLTTNEGRRVRLVSLAGIDPKPVRWLWELRAPVGEITLTPGYSGVGKSTFHAWMIAQITRGTLPGIHFGTPKPVIICAREDSWSRTIVPRLIAAGADRNLVYRAEVVSDDDQQLSLTLPADLDGLKAEIQDKGVVLVSIDPLLSVIDKDLDTFKASEVRTALEPLAELADETNGAILGNAHYNKGSAADPILKMANSAAFGEVSRAALAFAKDDDSGQYVISQAKNNLGRLDLPNLTYQLEPATVPTDEGPSEVARLVFTGESQRSVRDILNPHHGQDRTERDTARQIILDALSDGARKWTEVADSIEASGVSEVTGRRARDELKKGGTIVLNVGVWTWELAQPSSPVTKVIKEQQNPGILAQPVIKDFANGDRDLITLITPIHDGREDADQSLITPDDESDLDQPCPECTLSDGRHAWSCPTKPDPM
jgi:hypothetical protein